MLIMGYPQFQTQDDWGTGDGIPPIPEWQLDHVAHQDESGLDKMLDGNAEVKNVFVRLRNIFQRAQTIPLEPTRLHDLTSFVIHRLLSTKPYSMDPPQPLLIECLRYAIILYMFILQGPTYYSHEHMMIAMAIQLREQMQAFGDPEHQIDDAIHIWLLAIGMVASTSTPEHE